MEACIHGLPVSANIVRNYRKSLGINDMKIRLIEGDVKDTARSWNDRLISILRIDCNWDPGSLATLECLYSHVARDGGLICDDYGHHSGQRRAVDECFEGTEIRFSRID
jgi:hypothetical protein